MSDQSQQVVESIQNAMSSNQISSKAGQLVLEALDDVAVAGCQGVNIDEIDSEEITLVAVAIDASSSMTQHRDSVIDAYNAQFLKPLKSAQDAKKILVSTWVFSDEGRGKEKVRLVHGYTAIPDCPQLTRANYNPDGTTPLNDAAWMTLTGILSYGQTLRDSGTRTKCIVIVLTDGDENASKTTAVKVRTLAEDLLQQEIYVLSYVFFGDANQGAANAKKIGFPKQHMITSDLDDSSIRRRFGTVSASVISTSQTKVSANSLSVNAFFADGR